MKPQSEYFSVDLSLRPASASKRGALVRAFAMAADAAIDRALEDHVPDEVLIMVTLAQAPKAKDATKPAAGVEPCGCGAKGDPCSTPEAGRFLPEYCVTCGHALRCHAEVPK